MDSRQTLAESWLDEVEQDGVNLTPWEESFIEDLRAWLDRRRPLTELQIDTLERIRSQRTP